ncbi:MFS transporter [Lederbergia lenta]|uniref:MFS transporter n=1 Tax=Lederbergia lenta TaxID=1467 RepID=UPI00203F56BD|nr:MFS transporter [Lederbergia lenta]MCM3110311.1 MFS transporter [Lederbergia lenta]
MLPLSLFNFFYYWTISLINAFLPLFFQFKGMDPTKIGLLLAVGPFIAIFAQPLWGFISDRRQTAKNIILLLLILSFITSTGIFFGTSIIILVIAMLVFHFFMSPVQPLLESMSTAYAQEKGVSYGSIRIWGSIGFAIASITIGYLIGEVGIQYLWFVYATLIILAFIIATRLKDSQVKRLPITTIAIKSTFKNPKYLFFLIAALFIGTTTRMNDGMLGLYLKNLGASEGQIGLAWMASSLSEVPVIGLMYFLMKRIPLLVLIGMSGCFYSLRWFLYANLTDPTMLVLSQTMHSITFAIFMVASLQYVAAIVPREMLATGQTIYFATYAGLGAIIGNSAGGYYMDLYGAAFIYKGASVFALIGTCICFIMYMKSQKNKESKQILEV